MAEVSPILIPTYSKFTKIRQVGEYEYELPDPPNKKEILNSRIVTSNQRIERIIDEKYYNKLTTEAEQEAYYNKIMDYCEKGIWLYNNGNLEYITGRHFFYLNVYYSMGYYMRWTDSDRDFFYFWDIVEKDKNCAGGLVVSARRWGKSHKGASIALQVATESRNRKVGMQSKTDNDVYKDLYMKVVNGYRKMPLFLQPISSLGTNPQGGLKFEEPSRRSSKERLYSDDIFLNSEIDYRPSNEAAYDGAQQHFNIQDEIFKKQKADVEERLKTVVECCVDGDIIGKILAISTVEEIEGEAGARGEQIWKKSDPTNVNNLGQSANGFKRYFNPAFYGQRKIDEAQDVSCMDSYGYSNQTNAIRYFNERRRLLKGKDLSDFKRKYPFDIKEAFANRTQTNPFDIEKINQQLEWNEIHEGQAFRLIKGDFLPNPSNPNLIEWFPHDKGRWTFNWLPPAHKRNNVNKKGIHNIPGNYFEGVIGVDPVAQRTLIGKGSDFAAVAFRRKSQKFDGENLVIDNDPLSDMPIGYYCCRLPNVDVHHQDIEYAARFLGYPVNAERNTIMGLDTHFAHSDYYHYLLPRVKSAEGSIIAISNQKGTANYSGDERTAWLFMVATWLYENCGINDKTDAIGRVYFNELLKDLRDLDPSDWGPSDLTVAFLYAIQAINLLVEPKKPKVMRTIEIPMYRTEGNRSKRVG